MPRKTEDPERAAARAFAEQLALTIVLVGRAIVSDGAYDNLDTLGEAVAAASAAADNLIDLIEVG